MNTPLLDAMREQIGLNRFRFHVPGHAGHLPQGNAFTEAAAVYPFDLTELPPLDVLGSPTGVLRESQSQTAELFDAAETFYLVNGASSGILAAMLAAGLTESSRVLVARNAHRSVIHGLVLTGARPLWLLPNVYPEWGLWGEIVPDDLEQTLSTHPEIELFLMTHPTYEGIASDVHAIARICKAHGVKLIVDEAHGSLWPFSDNMPDSALTAGADAVIHSVHKSGGSLTQTALLHRPHGSAIPSEAFQEALNLLNTTSPSYVLLANLEATCAFLGTLSAQARLTENLNRIISFRNWATEQLQTIRVFSPPNASGTVLQVVLQSTKLDGETLAEQLEEEYHLAFESTTPYSVLFLFHPELPDGAIQALQAALLQIDVESADLPDAALADIKFALPDCHLTPREAYNAPGKIYPTEQAVGKVSRQVIAHCPPGIPIIMPGERIHPEHLAHLPESINVVEASFAADCEPDQSHQVIQDSVLLQSS